MGRGMSASSIRAVQFVFYNVLYRLCGICLTAKKDISFLISIHFSIYAVHLSSSNSF